MNKFLNIVLKGLFTAFVIVLTGGFIALNIKTSPSTSMVLVSSSVVNSLRMNNDSKKEEVKVEEVKLEEEVVELKEEEKKEEKIEEKVEEKKEEKKEEAPAPTPEPVQEQPAPAPQPSAPNPNGNYSPNTETTSGAATNVFSGYVTAYGPDCVGCGGYTARGDNVMNGNIYYNHPTYGTIRIVAGDRTILDKVVRISGIGSDPIIAIVRDTGGDIGFNKPKGIVLDLLFTSENSPEAANFGKRWATVEVLN